MAASDPELRAAVASLASNRRLAGMTPAERVEVTRAARAAMWERDCAAVVAEAEQRGEHLADDEVIRQAHIRRRLRLADMSRKAAAARRLRGSTALESEPGDHFLAGYLEGLREAGGAA